MRTEEDMRDVQAKVAILLFETILIDLRSPLTVNAAKSYVSVSVSFWYVFLILQVFRFSHIIRRVEIARLLLLLLWIKYVNNSQSLVEIERETEEI